MCLISFLMKLYCFHITSPFCPFVCLFENQTHSLKSTANAANFLEILEWKNLLLTASGTYKRPPWLSNAYMSEKTKLASSKKFHSRCFLTFLNVENEWK